MLYKFRDPGATRATAVGGKAATLAHLYQAGYPVPPGFVISASAFEHGRLPEAEWPGVLAQVAVLQQEHGRLPLAIRSSALSEDSAQASYAGEFETVLNVETSPEIRAAIETVYQSQFQQRVQAYREAVGGGRGPEPGARPSEIAVIVQQMVPAEMAGVLFTADPVTGSHSHMAGSFVRGLGDQLVSGEADGESFTLERPSGSYHGPAQMRPYARSLYKLAARLADTLSGPQDIEWAVAKGQVWLLQARPITTMQPYNAATGEWNDSRRGDYLWSNANFGEALPGVMTPLTWSLLQIYGEETFDNPLPGDNPLMGNIGGRFYVNLSLLASTAQTLGFSRERLNRESEEMFGNLPEDIDIPLIPFTRLTVLRRFLPFTMRTLLRRRQILQQFPSFTASLPARIADLDQRVQTAVSPAALAGLWSAEIEPLLRRAYQMLQLGTSRYENAYRPLHRQLAAQVGEAEANLLLSGVSSADEHLASLGPLLGLWRIAHGEMSRADYLQQYGHRGLHELEVSWERPLENPTWLDEQLAGLAEVNVPALLARREAEREAAWVRYRQGHPKQATAMQRELETAAAAARGREAIRSEVTRLVFLARRFALRAGALTGLGDGTFFLWLDELLAVLHNEETAVSHIPIRRQAHERQRALPPYPPVINGRFDPYAWAADPQHRHDLFSAHAASELPDDSASDAVIRGLPGSAGVVEGRVRHLTNLDEGHLLQPGEILVAATTNVGWTPLFPRATAVVTDVGAPLSHAAIVARELGIPAVVGTREATSRLKTGDLVRVDGTIGTVELLNINGIFTG